MTRIQIIIVAVLAIIIAGALGTFAFAEDGAGSTIAPSSLFYDVWTIVQPLAVLLASTVGPVLVTWIAARLIALLKISDEKQRLEIEKGMRDALHQSAANALKYAMAKAGMPPIFNAAVSRDVIADAIAYVHEKNPEALSGLDVHSDALRDIIISKVPDLLKAVK